MKATNRFVSYLLVIGALMTASSAYAQMAISNDGVIFPDDSEQNSAVVVPMNCPHGDSIVWDSNAESWVCATDLSVICPCAVGETGPAGGIVFYVTDGGLHGLEAAPAAQDTSGIWCSEATDIFDVDNITDAATLDSHSGAHNTPLIVAVCGDSSAAGKAAEYVWPNGQTDGFLPNKEELALMVLKKDTIGGFLSGDYWSSSEGISSSTGDTGRGAWLQNTLDGNQINYNAKDFPARLRAVRAF